MKSIGCLYFWSIESVHYNNCCILNLWSIWFKWKLF